ncbi:MAG: alpha/beta hydrolase, partial [Anaerolineales bacterium]
IKQVEAGNTGVLRPWLMDEIFMGWGSLENFAWGLYFAINCQNDFPTITPEITASISAEYPELEGYVRHAREMEICALWDLPAAPLDAEPVQSDIPTLVLAGGYDPITPPEWSKLTAENLDHAYYFELPASGHGVLGESACAREIQSAFLSDPEREPDASCLADEPDAQFILPDEVIIAPAYFNSVSDINIGAPSGKPWLEAAVLGALLVFIIEIVFVLMAGIMRLFRRDQDGRTTDLVARLTHPLAGITSVLGLAIPVLMTEINQALNNDPILRYFGLPADYPSATILGVVAPIFIILSLVLLILTVWSWVKRHGSLTNRLLLSTVSFMAIGFSFILIRWGLVTLLM